MVKLGKIQIIYILHSQQKFTACGQKEVSDNNTFESAPIMDVTATPPAIEYGEMRDSVYENAFFGFGCTLDDSWTVPSQEMIDNRASTEEVVIGEVFPEAGDPASLLTLSHYDMDVLSESSAANINIILESSVQDYNEEVYTDSSIAPLIQALEMMDAQKISVGKAKITFIGEERFGLSIYFELDDTAVYQKIIYLAKGQQLACIGVASYIDDRTNELIELFYPLD